MSTVLKSWIGSPQNNPLERLILVFSDPYIRTRYTTHVYTPGAWAKSISSKKNPAPLCWGTWKFSDIWWERKVQTRLFHRTQKALAYQGSWPVASHPLSAFSIWMTPSVLGQDIWTKAGSGARSATLWQPQLVTFGIWVELERMITRLCRQSFLHSVEAPFSLTQRYQTFKPLSAASVNRSIWHQVQIFFGREIYCSAEHPEVDLGAAEHISSTPE